MACIISISDENEGMWMIKNSLYKEFISLIYNRLDNSHKEISDELMKSTFVNGIALDKINDKPFAKKIATILEETSLLLAKDELQLESVKNSEPEIIIEIRELFRELSFMLSGWK